MAHALADIFDTHAIIEPDERGGVGEAVLRDTRPLDASNVELQGHNFYLRIFAPRLNNNVFQGLCRFMIDPFFSALFTNKCGHVTNDGQVLPIIYAVGSCPFFLLPPTQRAWRVIGMRHDFFLVLKSGSKKSREGS